MLHSHVGMTEFVVLVQQQPISNVHMLIQFVMIRMTTDKCKPCGLPSCRGFSLVDATS